MRMCTCGRVQHLVVSVGAVLAGYMTFLLLVELSVVFILNLHNMHMFMTMFFLQFLFLSVFLGKKISLIFCSPRAGRGFSHGKKMRFHIRNVRQTMFELFMYLLLTIS